MGNNQPKPLLHAVHWEGASILQQLQIEEALLRTDNRNWCLFNRGSPPAIVLGISCKTDLLICREKLAQSPIPLIRRFSGGGTVVVDENTWFVSFICNADALAIPPFPKHLMRWSSTLYQPLFPSLPFALLENDYVFGERKWGGNAQCISKGRWIHHTSILWDYHPPHMDYLLTPAKTPAYRQGRTHSDFLCRLRDYWPESGELFRKALLGELGKQFTIIETSGKECAEVQLLPHRKATAQIQI